MLFDSPGFSGRSSRSRHPRLSPRRFNSGLPHPGPSYRIGRIERTMIRRSAAEHSELSGTYDGRLHVATVWRIMQVDALASSLGGLLY